MWDRFIGIIAIYSFYSSAQIDIIIIIIIIIICSSSIDSVEFFTSALADGLSLEIE